MTYSDQYLVWFHGRSLLIVYNLLNDLTKITVWKIWTVNSENVVIKSTSVFN